MNARRILEIGWSRRKRDPDRVRRSSPSTWASTGVTSSATASSRSRSPSATADDPAVAKYAEQWAGEQVTTGDQARAFAKIMREHTLESTGGLTYAQMGRFQSADDPTIPQGTNDPAAAAKDDNGQPVSNGARNIWVTETALTTRAEHELHGRAALGLRDRRRGRAAADRHRAGDPRASRCSAGRCREEERRASRAPPRLIRERGRPRIARAPTSRSERRGRRSRPFGVRPLSTSPRGNRAAARRRPVPPPRTMRGWRRSPRRIIVGLRRLRVGPARARRRRRDLMGYGSTLTVVSVAGEGGPMSAAALDDAREHLLGRLVTATYVQRIGEPAEELVGDGARARGRSRRRRSARQARRRRPVPGSVSADVVRRAPCDVLVVG